MFGGKEKPEEKELFRITDPKKLDEAIERLKKDKEISDGTPEQNQERLKNIDDLITRLKVKRSKMVTLTGDKPYLKIGE